VSDTEGPRRPSHIVPTIQTNPHYAEALQLQGAQLHGAKLYLTDLDHAQLQGAVYDLLTAWPPDFDPREAGAIHQKS
jgi:hypothetical protein